MGSAGAGGLLAFRGSFFLIYELFTGTLEVKLFPDDNPGILASVPCGLKDVFWIFFLIWWEEVDSLEQFWYSLSVLLALVCLQVSIGVGCCKPTRSHLQEALLRVMAGTDGFTMDMESAVLRAMDATPELCSEMPLWGSSAVKRTWQVGVVDWWGIAFEEFYYVYYVYMFYCCDTEFGHTVVISKCILYWFSMMPCQVGNLIRLDHDSSSRLLRSAMKHLRQQQKYLPKLQPFPSFLKADGSGWVELQLLSRTTFFGFWSLKVYGDPGTYPSSTAQGGGGSFKIGNL